MNPITLTQAIDAFETALILVSPLRWSTSDACHVAETIKLESLPSAQLAVSSDERGCLRLFDRRTGALKALLRDWRRESAQSRILLDVRVELSAGVRPGDLRPGDLVRSAFGAYDWQLLQQNLATLVTGGVGEVYVDLSAANTLRAAETYADVGDIRTLAQAVRRANEAAAEALAKADAHADSLAGQTLSAAKAAAAALFDAREPAHLTGLDILADLLGDIRRELACLREESRRQTALFCDEFKVPYGLVAEVARDLALSEEAVALADDAAATNAALGE